MGITRYYTVTEEREVKVAAENPVDAALIGAAAFRYGQDVHGNAKNMPEKTSGRTTSIVRNRDLVAREDF